VNWIVHTTYLLSLLGTCNYSQLFNVVNTIVVDAIATPVTFSLLFNKAIYKDFATIKAALQEHAWINGFAISIHSFKEQRAIFKCTKGGKYDDCSKDPTVYTSKQRRNTSTIKTNCKYQV
jgi:hypothetical protein